MIRFVALTALLLVSALVPLRFEGPSITVGSKAFTESVILGEMLALLVEDAGQPAQHYRELGGTPVVYQSLLNGEIDMYPEYTGTLAKEIFADFEIHGRDDLHALLREQRVLMSAPLGFNNTYALGMRRERAAELGIRTISDLKRHPDLQIGFSHEFMEREDGWPNLQRRYGLPQTNVKGLDHDLAYRQLDLGAIDVIDVYTTDAKIQILELQVLRDDLQFFPRYEAVILYRSELSATHPEVVRSILRLEGQLDEQQMSNLNGRPENERISEARAAADFLAAAMSVEATVAEQSVVDRVIDTTVAHLDLVRRSLIPAILVAIPLGIWAAKRRTEGHAILALVSFVQTIPSLALLVLLMPLVAFIGLSSVGTGSTTAIVALFLYSLLPIVRNTHAGLQEISPAHLESAAALGLPPLYRLMHIELPLATGSILAGVKTAAVINVGFATLGALIGAGGYGQPILTGIRLSDTSLILQGALPAAGMALVVQGAFELAERMLLPRGLRAKYTSSHGGFELPRPIWSRHRSDLVEDRGGKRRTRRASTDSEI